jgi:hypothetical protein
MGKAESEGSEAQAQNVGGRPGGHFSGGKGKMEKGESSRKDEIVMPI